MTSSSSQAPATSQRTVLATDVPFQRIMRPTLLLVTVCAVVGLVLAPVPSGSDRGAVLRELRSGPTAVTSPSVPLYFEHHGDTYLARGAGYEL